MIKCTDFGRYTCIGGNNKPKKAYLTDVEAIEAAKIINEKYKKDNTKQVAYKCTNCQKYHLVTSYKKSHKLK